MGKYRYNAYRDIEIDISKLKWDDETDEPEYIKFQRTITYEYNKWFRNLRDQKDRAIAVMWLNIPIAYSRVVCWVSEMNPPFSIHHATSNRIMMVRPATRDTSHCQIPPYGTHYLKVECIVIEENTGKILLINERLGGSYGVIKLVSGTTNKGEFIANTAEREVLEETKIKAKTYSVVGFGQRTNTRFGQDEIIVVCLLFASEGQTPQVDGYELVGANWYTVDEAIKVCSSISKPWLLSAINAHNRGFIRNAGYDILRGKPHWMDFYVSDNNI
jgi:ADP-ribose pyrophosphatase YjhB (NUDIX family)